MSPSDRTAGTCLVTGAAGFLGNHLVRELLARGRSVRAVIRSTPLELEHPRLEIVRGDVENGERMVEFCEGVDTVFHTAARVALMGGKFATESYRQTAYATNVYGTENVIAACQQNGVKRLVHTSSIDVCFNFEEDVNMDGSTPYATTVHSLYAETKILSEQAVLAANGKDGLVTTALRPDGIYGPGSNLLLDGVFEQLVAGNFVATIGGRGALHDHVYVDNLVHAELLAEERLVEGSPGCGKAYFVTDGHRTHLFEFVQPLVEALGYEMPRFNIPSAPLMAAARAWQFLHFKVGLPEPLLKPHEVGKVAISHCGTNDDAKRDFGYQPVVGPDEAMNRCIDYYTKRVRVNS